MILERFRSLLGFADDSAILGDHGDAPADFPRVRRALPIELRAGGLPGKSGRGQTRLALEPLRERLDVQPLERPGPVERGDQHDRQHHREHRGEQLDREPPHARGLPGLPSYARAAVLRNGLSRASGLNL